MELARKPRGTSPDQFRKRLESLEVLYGSQKKAAEKLGVSASTYREYKSGKREPSKDRVTKANRLFGRNQRTITSSDFQQKLERHEETIRHKREARERQAEREQIAITSSSDYIRSQYRSAYVIQHTLELTPEYAAFDKRRPFAAQFMTPGQAFEKDKYLGKPVRQPYVYVIAAFSDQYVVDLLERSGLDMGELPSTSVMKGVLQQLGIEPGYFGDMMPVIKKFRYPTRDGYADRWDLPTMLSHLETKLHHYQEVTGRKRYTLIRFIGYQIP